MCLSKIGDLKPIFTQLESFVETSKITTRVYETRLYFDTVSIHLYVPFNFPIVYLQFSNRKNISHLLSQSLYIFLLVPVYHPAGSVSIIDISILILFVSIFSFLLWSIPSPHLSPDCITGISVHQDTQPRHFLLHCSWSRHILLILWRLQPLASMILLINKVAGCSLLCSPCLLNFNIFDTIILLMTSRLYICKGKVTIEVK